MGPGSRWSSLVALCLVATAAPARGEDLAAFLAAASSAARPSTTVRGDGELVTSTPEGTVRHRVAIVQRPAGDLYVEVQSPRVRALLPATGAGWLAAGSSPAPFPADQALAGSEFSRDDLQPFDARRFGSPTIVDRSAEDLTVSLDPRDSQYSLAVLTFDREKRVPIKAMLYKDTLSNLLKMRRESQHVQVGGRWLPTEIAIENFPLKATSTLSLTWTAVGDESARFDPTTFASAPPLLGP
jgi:hypothetical protein